MDKAVLDGGATRVQDSFLSRSAWRYSDPTRLMSVSVSTPITVIKVRQAYGLRAHQR